MSMADIFGVDNANAIIYMGSVTFSYLLKDHVKQMATKLLKDHGEAPVSMIVRELAKCKEWHAVAEAAPVARVEAGQAASSILTGKVQHMPKAALCRMVVEKRLLSIVLPTDEGQRV